MLLGKKMHVHVPFCGTRGDMCAPVIAKHSGRKWTISDYWAVKTLHASSCPQPRCIKQT